MLSVSSALSLSLKSFPSSLLKKYPKKYQRFEKVPKSEKRNDDSTRPPAARVLFFSEKLPCTRRTETLPRVSKGCEKTSRTRIWLFLCALFRSALFFSSGVGVPPARQNSQTTTKHFFLFSYAEYQKCKIRFFFGLLSEKKTIARILLKLPHANDKNAMRLSIRTGE